MRSTDATPISDDPRWMEKEVERLVGQANMAGAILILIPEKPYPARYVAVGRKLRSKELAKSLGDLVAWLERKEV